MPAAVAVLRGPEHVFEYTNERYDRLVGRRLVGRNVREALPEIEGQGFFELLDRVYSTGEPYVGEETLVEIDRQGTGELEREYLNFVYTPIRGVGGAVDSIFVHAVEVTELVRSRQQVEALVRELEDERARIEAVLEQLPAGVVPSQRRRPAGCCARTETGARRSASRMRRSTTSPPTRASPVSTWTAAATRRTMARSRGRSRRASPRTARSSSFSGEASGAGSRSAPARSTTRVATSSPASPPSST